MARDWEERLIEDLARLRRQPPFRVDVAARVLEEVRRMGPVGARASRRRLGIAAAATLALAGVVLLLAVVGLPAWAEEVGLSIGRAAGTSGVLARWLAETVSAAARGTGRTLNLLAAFRGLAAAVGPVLVAALVVALAAMGTVTSYVVGRDLRRTRTEAR